MPATDSIDRNKFDYGDGDVNFHFNEETAVDDIIEAFKDILKLKNRFISAADVKKLFGKLIRLYRILEKEQKSIVLINWATEFYVDPSVLKQTMNQNITDFTSLAKIVNDLKAAIEPQYMWIFRKMSSLTGGQEMIKDIQEEVLTMFLKCPEMTFSQKLAVNELRDNLKTIQPVKSEVVFAR